MGVPTGSNEAAAKRKRDSAQPKDAKRKRDSAQPQENDPDSGPDAD